MSRLRRLLWNPIVSKEIHSRMRSWRAAAVISAFLAALTTAGLLAYRPFSTSIGSIGDAHSLGLASRGVFDALGGTALALIALVVPGLVGATISGERERQTLDLLLCTPVRPLRIVIGKFLSSLLFVLLLVVAAIPVFSIVFLLGGLPAGEVVKLVLIILVSAVVVGALAMLCSAVMRRPAGSIVSSYALMGLLFAAPNLAPVLLPPHETAATYTGYAALGSSGPVAVGTSGPIVNGVVPSGVRPLVRPPSSSGQQSSGRFPNNVPWMMLMSPLTTTIVTLSSTTLASIDPSCAGANRPSCPQRVDTLTDGILSGWQAWQVFCIADLALATLLIGLAVLVLRGRLPQPLRRPRRLVDAEAWVPGP